MQLIWTCDLALNRCFTCSSHFGEGRACFQALQSNFNKGEQHNIDSRSKFAVNIIIRVGGDTDTNTRGIKNLIQSTGRYVSVSLHSWTVLKSPHHIYLIAAECNLQFILQNQIFLHILLFSICVLLCFSTLLLLYFLFVTYCILYDLNINLKF